MPDEPNQPIEGDLRAWAESRRASQPPEFEMHAATRRMLHGEAARVHGKPVAAKPAGSATGGFLWWRSVLVGATLAFAIGCVIWVSLPARGPMQLAKTDSAPERQSAAVSDERARESAPGMAMDAPPPQMRRAGAASLAANEADQGGDKPAGGRAADGGADASSLMIADAKVAQSRAESTPLANRLDMKKEAKDEAAMPALAFSAPAAPAPTERKQEAESLAVAAATKPSASSTTAPAGLATGREAAQANEFPLRQRFQQRAATGGEPLRRSLTVPEWPVLREFEFAVGATQITVSDRDGSSYAGAFDAQSPAGAFVVTGTNVTLGQAVRFEGTYEQSGTNLLRVTGRARIGADRELTVDAAPAPPR